MVDITGIPKGKVLAALYNASQPIGLGVLEYDPTPMTEEEANEILKTSSCFDYLKGRVMKVELDNDIGFNEWSYDRDNGAGAAQRAIDSIILTG